MAFVHSPRSVTDGLVLAVDGANSTSFRGPAQTNLLTLITQNHGDQNTTFFKTANGTETVNIPGVGTKSVKYVDVYNDYVGGSGQCCLALFTFGDFTAGVSGSTTYSYSILYKSATGYTHPNYMYRYEFNGGTYLTEQGIFDTGNRTALGDGWYHAWGTFTTQPTTTRMVCYLFHYEYATYNRVHVAAAQITQGTYIGAPQHMLTPAQVRGTTVATGGGWTDLSENGYSGELINGTVFNTSNGGSLVFDGTNDYVNIGNQTKLQLSSEITIHSWIKGTSFSGSGNIVSKNENNGYRFRVNPSGQVTWFDRGGTNPISTGTGVITTGVWYNITVVGDASGLKIYVNGSLNISGGSAYAPLTSSGNFEIGAASGFGEYFNGSISNVLVYNRALTSSEILQNFNATRSRFGV